MSEGKKEPITDKKVSRRSMLKYSAALAAGVVAGVAVEYGVTYKSPPPPPPSLKPPLSPEIQAKVDSLTTDLINRHAGESWSYSDCKMNCMTDCTIKVYYKNGKVTSIMPDDFPNAGMGREDAVGLDAIKKGRIQYRPCPLGLSWRYMVNNPNRLLYPMKRVGPKGNPNSFVRISWTEALDTIYQNMKQTMDKYGILSLFVHGSSNSAPFQLIRAGLTSWGAQSHSGFDVELSLMQGNSTMTGPGQADIFKTKLVIMIGRNPVMVEGPGGTWGYFLLLAKEQGIKFIHIDPRYTADAQVLGAQWIPIRVGTDCALLLAIANVLVKENLYDKQAVATWVEPNGFAEWQSYLLGVTPGDDGKIDRTPEWAEKITGIPADTIRGLARLYGATKPAKLYVGWENSRSMSMGTSRAAMALAAMTGNLFTPGGGHPFADGYFKCDENAISNFLPAPSTTVFKPTNPYTVPVLLNVLKYQKAILLRDQLDSGQITPAEYMGRIGGNAAATPPNIKLVMNFSLGSKNHIATQYGTNERLAAMKKVWAWNFGWFLNGASLYFDILVPGCEGGRGAIEEPGNRSGFGLTRFKEDGAAGLGARFKYCAPTQEPLGEARPEEWAYVNLAKRFGVGQQYNVTMDNIFAMDQWDFKTWNTAIEKSHQDAWETWIKDPAVAKLNPPSWDAFKKNPVIIVGDAVSNGPYATSLRANTSPFVTASKKLEIHNGLLADPAEPRTMVGSNLWMGKLGRGATLVPQWVSNNHYTIYDPQSSTYPLVIITPNTYYRIHSCGFNNMALRGENYRHACWMSVADAKARGIKDGDLVRVFSHVGEIMVPAYVTSRITPGTVAVYHSGIYTPSQWQTQLQPDGVDTAGCASMTLEDAEPDEHRIGRCIGSGVVQVQKIRGGA